MPFVNVNYPPNAQSLPNLGFTHELCPGLWLKRLQLYWVLSTAVPFIISTSSVCNCMYIYLQVMNLDVHAVSINNSDFPEAVKGLPAITNYTISEGMFPHVISRRWELRISHRNVMFIWIILSRKDFFFRINRTGMRWGKQDWAFNKGLYMPLVYNVDRLCMHLCHFAEKFDEQHSFFCFYNNTKRVRQSQL